MLVTRSELREGLHLLLAPPAPDPENPLSTWSPGRETEKGLPCRGERDKKEGLKATETHVLCLPCAVFVWCGCQYQISSSLITCMILKLLVQNSMLSLL